MRGYIAVGESAWHGICTARIDWGEQLVLKSDGFASKHRAGLHIPRARFAPPDRGGSRPGNSRLDNTWRAHKRGTETGCGFTQTGTKIRRVMWDYVGTCRKKTNGGMPRGAGKPRIGQSSIPRSRKLILGLIVEQAIMHRAPQKPNANGSGTDVASASKDLRAAGLTLQPRLSLANSRMGKAAIRFLKKKL